MVKLIAVHNPHKSRYELHPYRIPNPRPIEGSGRSPFHARLRRAKYKGLSSQRSLAVFGHCSFLGWRARRAQFLLTTTTIIQLPPCTPPVRRRRSVYGRCLSRRLPSATPKVCRQVALVRRVFFGPLWTRARFFSRTGCIFPVTCHVHLLFNRP